MRTFITYTLVLTVAMLQIGCSSTTSIPADPEKARTMLESGDRVIIHLSNGTQAEESVARIDDKGIHTRSGGYHHWNEIVRIEKTEISAARSAGAGIGVLAILAIIAIALFASSADGLGD